MSDSIIIGYDPVTLREKVDESALEARLDELGQLRSSDALNERVALLRLAGRLDEAWDVANEAVRQARFGGDRERLLLARVRRAQVQQFTGKLDAALVDLTSCVNEARAHDWASAEAFALQHRGKVNFELGNIPESLRDFRDALTIRVRIHSSPDMIDSSMIAIAVAEQVLESQDS
jgi:tetratricopeptide (TPR) repeat protein